MPLLCLDCRYLLPPHTDEEGADERRKCDHPSSTLPGIQSLVTGVISSPYQITGSLARAWKHTADDHELCGPDGQFFEPKQQPGFI